MYIIYYIINKLKIINSIKINKNRIEKKLKKLKKLIKN